MKRFLKRIWRFIVGRKHELYINGIYLRTIRVRRKHVSINITDINLKDPRTFQLDPPLPNETTIDVTYKGWVT